jgi:hypothetical protein
MEGVANAGVLLAVPALIGEGLLSSAERIYQPLKAGFYGLHSILLCLVMMALLRIKSIEGLSAHQPGELGILLGLDRVPEVKTLRRKLAELGEQQQAAKLAAALTERWAQGEPDELGVLYIDGHVTPTPGASIDCRRRSCRNAASVSPRRPTPGSTTRGRALVLRHQPHQPAPLGDDRAGRHPRSTPQIGAAAPR